MPGWSSRLEEAALPIRNEVAGAAEILGIDPLYVANEGKLVAVVVPEAADAALAALSAIALSLIVDLLCGAPASDTLDRCQSS